MPEAAFEETERQFLGLLDTSSGDEALVTRLYVMEGVAARDAVAERIAERYTPLAAIYEDPPDVLIISGSNPIELDIRDEPYWDELVTLLTWASENVPSVLASCLSAHAALLTFDGIERRRLSAKCTGVMAQRWEPGHPLTSGLPADLVLPHSRLNSTPTDQLLAAGYDVPITSEDGEWSAATRVVDRCRMVLMQSHPEYGPTSLLREYHRDARRYVLGERDQVPVLPRNCVAPEDWNLLVALQRRIAAGERNPALITDFPFDEVGARATKPWATAAIQIYANWLAGVPARSN
jgi:homoserine O-succinyltransferase/O-acetyltransferase